jgi:2-oxoisovalerate dehydrogenase E1 component
MSDGKTNLQVDPDTLCDIYTNMRRIRIFEETAITLFERGEIKGTAHSYMGEEAIAASVCGVLNNQDFIASYHRGHGHCIAKGASLDLMMAELMGKQSGYCQGLGGSMHIADMNLNIVGANGIVGAAMPLSTGAALASKLRNSDQVAVAFFGDGASNQGIFHESMNLAAVWNLPLIFVCENNQYALSTPYKNTTAVSQIATRASSYEIPGITIDGNDAVEVYLVFRDAAERARMDQGPTLIEAMTYRWGQHSMRANLRDPRPEDEFQKWKDRDPLIILEDKLLFEKILSKDDLKNIDQKVSEDIKQAVEFARQSPEPDFTSMLSSVYVPHKNTVEPMNKGSRELSYVEALNEAMLQEMERDNEVFLMGEDVGKTGGIFQVSKGLYDRFGSERVRDTPISEATFTGCGVGAAIAGMRPIVEIQIFDFVALAMDMLVNQAAKFRFMLGGKPSVPLVVRGPQGGGVRLAAQHSQSLEAWFTHVPGLVVVAPSTPYDAKGLLVSSIRDDNPVIFLEQKMLYLGKPGPVPEELYAIPLGKADVKRQGTDITILAIAGMLPRALNAASMLEREGISAEVIDPRTLQPLDKDTIIASVKKTNRLLIVHEAWVQGGFGAEISAMVMELAFDYLDAPVARLGAPHTPMPYNDNLERSVIPSQDRILQEAKKVMGYNIK